MQLRLEQSTASEQIGSRRSWSWSPSKMRDGADQVRPSRLDRRSSAPAASSKASPDELAAAAQARRPEGARASLLAGGGKRGKFDAAELRKVAGGAVRL